MQNDPRGSSDRTVDALTDRLFGAREQEAPLEPGERWTVFGFALLVGGLFVAGVFIEYEPKKLSALAFAIAWIPLLVIHELAHALAARIVGWRVCKVVVGMGRTVGHVRILGIEVELKSLPIEGFMIPAPRDLRGVRWKDAFISFAGPGAELLFVAGAIALVGWDRLTTSTDEIPMLILQASCLAATVGIVLTLVPHGGSDGMRIVQCCLLPREAWQEALFTPIALESQRLAREGRHEERVALLEAVVAKHPETLTLTTELVLALSFVHRFVEARALYRALTERALEKTENSSEKVSLRDDLADLMIILHLTILDDEAYREVDAIARGLHERRPGSAEATAYWGAVQACIHGLGGGVEVIERSYHLAVSPQERRVCATLHALSELRLGRRDRAARLIAPLSRLRKVDWLVAWVSDEIEKHRVG